MLTSTVTFVSSFAPVSTGNDCPLFRVTTGLSVVILRFTGWAENADATRASVSVMGLLEGTT